MKLEVITPKKNYIPGSMSFGDGFLGPKGDNGFVMVADYNKAKKIIEQLLSDGKQISTVEMGLDGDWSINSMIIWEAGEFTGYDMHDNSIWAEPIMIVNFLNAPSETYPVWYKRK